MRPRLCALLLLLVACGDPASTLADANDASDAGTTAVGDAAARDAIGPEESAPIDSSAPVDARDDAPTTDARAPDDAAVTALAPVHGVTLDDVSDVADVVASLSALPHRATARVVFDEGQTPTAYAAALPQIHAVADVMGEILDSEYVKDVAPTAYVQRANDYLAAFPTDVDVWEVGNEINGNWLDTTSGGVADVVAKMTGAFDAVKAKGGKTALTLYGCSDADAAHDLIVWSKANVPPRMTTGLDWVLVSYYEGDCGAPRSDWASVFAQLRAIYPTAALGFGETGNVDASSDEVTDVATDTAYLEKYYAITIDDPRWIGGYFWWFYVEEMVPKTKPMWSVVAAAMK